jgi:hypothetical protein
VTLQASGTVTGDVSDCTAKFESASAVDPGIVVFDYGQDAAPEFVSVKFRRQEPMDGAAPADLWAVHFSDDGVIWHAVGAPWRVRTTCVTLNWAACLPHRFWKLELTSSREQPTATFSEFAWAEYTGVSVCTPVASEYLTGISLVCPVAWKCGAATLTVPSDIGTAVVIDCKGRPEAFVGLSVAAEVVSTLFTTTFSVEYSDDASAWFPVGTVVVSRDMATTVWESEGAYRYWRVSVVKHYGGRHISLRCLEFLACGPSLYLRQRRHVTRVSDTVYRARTRIRSAFVSVRAKLPPRTRFVIEMNGDAPQEWLVLATFANPADAAAVVAASWPSAGSSVLWRCRCIDGPPGAAVEDAQWYRFCNVASHVARPDRDSVSVRLAEMEFTPGCSAADLFAESSMAQCPVLTSPAAELPDDSVEDESAMLAVAAAVEVDCSITFYFAKPATFSCVQIGRVGDAADDVSASVELLERDDTKFVTAISEASVAQPLQSLGFAHEQRTSSIWRVRFTRRGEAAGNKLRISSIRWMFTHGAVGAAALRVHPLSTASNTLAAATARGHFAQFGARLDASLAAAAESAGIHFQSVLEEAELPPIDELGDAVVKFHQFAKQTQKVVTHKMKSLKREANGGQAASASASAAPLAVDAAAVLAMYKHALLDELIAVTGPLPMQELKLTNRDAAPWPLPKTEYRGRLQPNTFLRLDAGLVTIGFRWKITPDALHHVPAIVARPSGGDLDPHVAVATLVVDLKDLDWVPATHFPVLGPLLTELAATGQQLCVVFATGALRFSEAFPLAMPNSTATLGGREFGFEVNRGVNLLYELRPKACTTIAMSYVDCFTADVEDPETVASTLAVVHATSTNATEVQMRFTLPVDTALGFDELLDVSTVTFELSADVESGSRDLSFGAANASLTLPGAAAPFAAAVRGCVAVEDGPRCRFHGRVPTSEWALDGVCRASTAVLRNMSFAGAALLADMSFVPLSFIVSGDIALGDSGDVLSAHVTMPVESGGAAVIDATLSDMGLDLLLDACRSLIGSGFRSEPWLADCGFSVSGSLTLASDAVSQELGASGAGTLHYHGAVGEATFAVAENEVTISAMMPAMQVQQFRVTAHPHRLVLVEFVGSRTEPPVIRVSGLITVLTAAKTACQLELSANGLALHSKSSFVDVMIHAASASKPAVATSVVFDRTAFEAPIAAAVRDSHIISALVGRGITFAFVLQAVSVEACDVARRTLILCFSGVLLGAGYTVYVTCCDLSSDASFVDTVAQRASMAILEHCRESTWPLVKEFVAENGGGGSGGADELEGSFRPRHPSASVEGVATLVEDHDGLSATSFLAHWATQCDDDLEDVTADATDPL